MGVGADLYIFDQDLRIDQIDSPIHIELWVQNEIRLDGYWIRKIKLLLLLYPALRPLRKKPPKPKVKVLKVKPPKVKPPKVRPKAMKRRNLPKGLQPKAMMIKSRRRNRGRGFIFYFFSGIWLQS